MAKQGAKTAMPRLRFREFGDKPKWPVTKLGSRGKFIGGGTPSRENAEFWMGRHPWISSSDVSEEDIRSIRPSRFITDEAVAKSATQAVPTGSVLIISRVGVGKIAVTEEQLYTSQDFVSLVPSTDCPEFLAYLLKSRKSALLAFNQGMAIKGFTRDDIAGLDVPVPERAEQQKIANCLTSLDEVIAAQGRKVEALKAHKRGLMQQLFPREGETRPRLRFPEFRNAPEWETSPLGLLIQVASGQVDPTESPYCDWPHVGGDNIEPETGNLAGLRSAHEDGVTSGKYLFDERDVLYSKIRPVLNKVAVPALRGICSADIYPIRPANSDITREFLAYLLRSVSFVEYATKNSERGKIPKINREALAAYSAPLPKPSEQQRIADCLASLDTRITAETARLAALKTHKQGLMQQLFPSQNVA